MSSFKHTIQYKNITDVRKLKLQFLIVLCVQYKCFSYIAVHSLRMAEHTRNM